jgi:hypothetical protein
MSRESFTGQLYLASDGVQRGYYVYFHRERDTGDVFYVGKGCGRRAWDQTSRHIQWQKKVATLGANWEVVIVKDNLSELEAFELERDLVAKHGGASYDGGILVNRVPGGEHPLSLGFTIPLSRPGQVWITTYEQSRKFRELERNEQEQVARQLRGGLQAVIAGLDELRESHNDDEALDDSATDVDCIVGSQIDRTKDFLRRRVSWKDFALGVEEMLDDLGPADINQLHKKAQPLASEAAAIAARILRAIDLGNRLEAEELADRAAKQVETESYEPDRGANSP